MARTLFCILLLNEALRPPLPGFLQGFITAIMDVIGSNVDQQNWCYGVAVSRSLYGC